MTSILIVAALLVVPGVGAALAFAPPGAASIETRVGLVVGLGYALVAGLAITLALARVLSRPTFIGGAVILTVAVWGLALRQASLRKHGTAILAQARESPFTLASGLVVIAVFALTWPLYPAANNLAKHAPWRYWADGLEIAAAGRVPPTTDQWGTVVPTAVDKVVLDAFEGGISFLIGPNGFVGMRAILTVAAVGFAAVLIALGRELGLRAFALLVPAFILLFPGRLPIAGEVAEDLSTYKAEDVGRVVSLAGVLVGMYAVTRRGHPVLAIVAGAIFALAGLTHGVSTIVAMVILALYAIAALLVERSAWRRILVSGVVIAVIAALGYVATLQLSGGDLGFQRVTGGPTFAGFPPHIDPSRSFDRAEVVRIPASEGPFIPPGTIGARYADDTIDSEGQTVLGALALAVLAVTTVVVVVAARRFVPLAVVAWGLVAALIAGAFFFSYRYDTKVPGDFGVRRLYDYASFPPALIVPAAIEVLALWLFRRRPMAVAALVLVAAVLATIAAIDRIPEKYAQARMAINATHDVARVVPCNARMLPNARSAGAWEALTGRRSVIEGLAPYLRPEIMARVLPTLFGARKFFADAQAHRAYLARQDIDYIVVLRNELKVGSWRPFETDAGAIAALPGVEVVSSSRAVRIYAVGPAETERVVPPSPRCPL